MSLLFLWWVKLLATCSVLKTRPTVCDRHSLYDLDGIGESRGIGQGRDPRGPCPYSPKPGFKLLFYFGPSFGHNWILLVT